MKQKMLTLITLIIAITFIAPGCGNNSLKKSKPLIAEPCDPAVDEDCTSSKEPEPHAIFKNQLGEEIPVMSVSTSQPDSTGLYPTNDYDGDGIENDQEIFTNKLIFNNWLINRP